MWGEPIPEWRTAQKHYKCEGDDCATAIAPGERYLDRAVRHPTRHHLRYCQSCAEPILARANGYHYFDGRNDFPDRYQQHISSARWRELKNQILKLRGNRCQRCGHENASLDLHHLHYRSLGNEQPEDVELLCPECHVRADKERAKTRSQPDYNQEGWIVEADGERWGKFEPGTIYLPLPDGRYVPDRPHKKPGISASELERLSVRKVRRSRRTPS